MTNLAADRLYDYFLNLAAKDGHSDAYTYDLNAAFTIEREAGAEAERARILDALPRGMDAPEPYTPDQTLADYRALVIALIEAWDHAEQQRYDRSLGSVVSAARLLVEKP